LRNKLKTIFQNIVSFLVNSNLWIALGSLAWIEQTRLLSGSTDRNIALYVLVFSATFFIYNFHRLNTKPDKNTETLSGMHEWMDSHVLQLKLFMVASVLAIITCVFFINIQSILLLLFVGTVSVFYAVPLPFTNGFRLRDIGVLKPVFVAVVWSVVCVLLPIVSEENSNNQYLFLTAHCFLFFLAITIPFDIRDLKFDKENLKFPTIPMILGISAAKWISLFTLLISGFVVWWAVKDFALAIVVWYIGTAFLIYKSKEESDEYHYTFWLDGTIIAGCILFYLNNSFKVFS